MGKIDRLKRITLARIEAFLDSIEKPEFILPQLVREMDRQVNEAAKARAKALAAVNGAHRRLDEANGKTLRLGKGAELAVRANDIETARQAIAAQIEAEQQAQKYQAELESAEKAYRAASAVHSQLADSLMALKEKKRTLLRQHRQQQLTKQLQEKYTQSLIEPGRSILDTVARIETQIEQQQIEIEVQNELTKTLGVGFDQERIQKLEYDSQVDQRLNEIKKHLDKG